MKQYPFILCLLLFSSSLFAQFPCNTHTWVNPYPMVAYMNDVDFLGPDTIWVAASNDNLLRSTDAGQTWEIREGLLNGFSAEAIEFLDADTAILAAKNGNQGRIYRSTDGGESWIQFIPPTSMGPAGDIHFINHDTGFVATTSDTYRTTDAGQSWSVVGPDSYKVDFVNKDTGLIKTGNTSLRRTTNGGQNWSLINVGVLRDFAFVDSDTVYAFGGSSNYYKSTDAGANWTPILPTGLYGSPYVMTFQDSIGYVGTVSNQTTVLFKSTDYGQSYSVVYIYPRYNPLLNVNFRNADQGMWVGRYGAMLHTADGGATIDAFPKDDLGSPGSIYQVDFPTPDSGYVASYGRIGITTDGGQTWSPQVLPALDPLWGIDFWDSQKGLVVGPQGVTYRTTNGGGSWTAATPNSGNNYKVQWVNDSVAYVCGNYSGLRKTTDGGQTWGGSSFGISGTNTFVNLSFYDEMNGAVVGNNGQLVRTTDGGATWTMPSTGTTSFLTGIEYKDSLNVYAGGDQGVYLRSSDGGATWTTGSAGPGLDIVEFQFVDSLNGFMHCFDFASYTYQTSDGGSSWLPVFGNLTSAGLRSIHFFDQKHGIIAGGGNSILKLQIGLDSPVAADGYVCSPGSVLLTTNTGSGTEWYSDSALTNLVSGGPIFLPPMTTENDTFYVVDTDGNCQSEATEVILYVLPAPQLSATDPDTVCFPNTVDLTLTFADSAGVNGQVFYWADSFLNQAVSNPAAVDTSGTYFIQKVSPNGCTDMVSVTVTIEICFGVEDALLAGWEFGPNPFEKAVQVRAGEGTGGPVHWELMDIQGKTVQSGSWEWLASGETRMLEPRGLPAGAYWLLLRTDGKILRKLLVKT